MPTSTSHGSAAPGPAVGGRAGEGVGGAARGRGTRRRSRRVRQEPGVFLRRHALLIVVVTLATLGGALAYAVQQAQVYTASALVLLRDRESDDRMRFMRGVSGLGSGNVADELAVLNHGHDLAMRAARRIVLLGREPTTREPLTILEDLRGPDPVAQVAARLPGQYVGAVPAAQGSDVIAVTAMSRAPGEAALLANVYAESFVAWTEEVRGEAQARRSAHLQEQIDARTRTMHETDEVIAAYMRAEGAVALDVRTARVVGRLAELDAELDRVVMEEAAQASAVAELEADAAAVEPAVAARVAGGVGHELPRLERRRDELRLALDVLERRNPGLRTGAVAPPEVARLRGEAADLDARIAAVAAEATRQDLLARGGPAREGRPALMDVTQGDTRRRLVEARVALATLAAQRASITRRVAEQERELDVLPEQAIHLGGLVRRRQAAGLLRESLREAYIATATMSGRSRSGRAEVLRPALIPTRPYTREAWLHVAAGLVGGLALGLTLAGLRQAAENRIRRPADLQRAGHALLAAIPTWTPPAAGAAEGGDGAADGGEGAGLASLVEPVGAVAEGYRGLCTALQFCRPDSVVETVLVTSPRPGEGKSTTAANLAVAMARTGRRTVLVDADLRRPSLHRKLGVARRPGLADLLFEAAPDPAPTPTGVERLDVVTGGRPVPNPSELLASHAFAALVAALRGRYDMIVIDAPPVLAATDAALLSALADATVLVAAAGRTRRPELSHACEVLEDVGAHVVGVVLNGADPGDALHFSEADEAGEGAGKRRRRAARAGRPAPR